MTGRTTPEWIAKHPDQSVPPRVRLRVFERCGGRCHISGRKIGPADKWDLEHIVPLADGGEHREGNIAPALIDEHKKKTSREATQRAKERRVRQKHLGIHKTRFPMRGGKNSRFKKKIDGTVEERD